MSFLKQAYALEQEVLEDVVEPTGEEFVEVDAETETTRQEAEAMGEELDRAVAVHKELENQNDTVREILEQDGEITPATAAVLEVARRTAAAGLGLDPDQEGKELVDIAGLESLVATKSVVALEEAEKASKSLWEKIKALWNAFLGKMSEFWNWLMKLLDFTSKQNKALVNKLKAIDNEAFDKGLEVLNSRLHKEDEEGMKKDADGLRPNYGKFKKSDFAAFDVKGKIYDISGTVHKALSSLDSVRKNFDNCVLMVEKEIKQHKANSDQSVKVGSLEVIQKVMKDKFPHVSIQVINTTHNFDTIINAIYYTNHSSGLDIPKVLKFSKEELINTLLNTDKACKDVRKYIEQAFKRYKVEADKSKQGIEKSETLGETTYYRFIFKSNKEIFKAESAITRQITKVTKTYARIAQEIIDAGGSVKQEEK